MPSDAFIRPELVRPGGLRDQLFALLEAAGLRQKDVAARLGSDPSKISRIKSGEQSPTESDIRAWASVCGADPAPLVAMLAEARSAARASRLGERTNQADVQRRYLELYRATPLVREFQSAVIPGMLQTSSYARQMFVEGRDLHAQLDLPADIEDAITARMARQAMLYEPGHRYEFLIDEAVLHRRLVPPAVLRAQLDRLLHALSIPSVHLGIIPMDAQLKAIPWLPIALFVGDATEAAIETPAEERFYTGDDATPFVALLDRLWMSAVDGERAAELITAVRDSLTEATAAGRE
ncbi:helix-turn-helix transcriptional regulator [uncultured Pseudonocardia sp.]|jgi:transcriptional regulator with XRE-family HTH domain|uniref:helix-turn-helix domain-containing protein n=1 Tax=uncultured Pseudonocardia sp. TaxID=211455 RepID=UPI00262172FB|nr:helix-turn-helix transcriptional regulator [uncultured Pseudonocardia sp.]